jgi:hypothetical protein
MRHRAATSQDWKQIEEMHAQAGYGFQLPEELKGAHVVEEDGIIIAAGGYELAAQIVAVLNPEIISPHRKLEAIKALHAPLAREVLAHDIKSVYAFCDPQFIGFEKRLMRLGWSRKMWNCCFLERAEIQKVFG